MRYAQRRKARIATEKRSALIEKGAIALASVLGVTAVVLWAYGYGLMLAQGVRYE